MQSKRRATKKNSEQVGTAEEVVHIEEESVVDVAADIIVSETPVVEHVFEPVSSQPIQSSAKSVTWSVSTSSRAFAGDANANVTGDAWEIVKCVDDSLVIKEDGVYSIHACAENREVGIVAKQSFMGVPLSSSLAIATSLSIVNQILTLKKGDVISVWAAAIPIQQKKDFDPNARSREHVIVGNILKKAATSNANTSVAFSITRIC